MWSRQRGPRCQLEGVERSFCSLQEAGCLESRRVQHDRWLPSSLLCSHLCWLLFWPLRVPTETNGGRSLMFDSQLVHHGGKFMGVGAWGTWSHCTFSQAAGGGMSRLSSLCPLYQARIPAHEKISVFKVCLPFSATQSRNSLRDSPEVCLPANSRIYLVDNQYFPAEYSKAKITTGSTLEYLWITFGGGSRQLLFL